MRILLVEPDPVQAQIIYDYLPHEVYIVSDGHQAIQAIDELKVDMVISEHIFAVTNSFEMLYEIRSYQDLANLPVILFSSTYLSSNTLTSETFSRLNLAGYLYKPTTTLKQLNQLIERTRVSHYAKNS